MPANSDYLLSTVDRALAVRSRGDIAQVAVPVAGQPSFVLKDPLTLEHFQLTPAEHFLFEQLREPVTLAELKRKFETKFAPRTISHVALQQGINQLFEQGLLVSTATAQGKQLLERAAERRRTERWQHLLRMLSFRVASWDSAALIDSLHAKLRWLFSPLTGFASLAVVGYALWLLVGHASKVFAKLPSIGELWQPRFLVLWLVTIVVLKIFHELGHAVTCRHYGGRCQEMGVMLLAFFPALYCDVSDVWRMPNKWHRMAVAAAGMVVELILAAMAFIAWWHSEPGPLNSWLFGVAIICSVGTLVVNANPLLRYDAYYLLADWLEIPNMSGRGQGLLGERLRRWLLAEPVVDDPLLSRRQQRRLAVYGVASRAYSIVVLIAIYAMLFALARPYHLENLVFTLALFTVVGLVLPPLMGIWRLLRNPANRARLRRSRVATLGGFLGAVAAAVLFWPVRHTVEGSAVLIPAEGHTIYATVAGELMNAVAPGTVVRAGDVIAELRDPQIELAVALHAGEFAVKQAHFQQINTLRALDSRVSLQLPTVQAELADAESQLAQYQRRAGDLILRSPVDGTVIAPPQLESDNPADRLATWSGSPLDARNRHCWIEPGTVLCTVGDSKKLAALVTIDERDVAEVQPGEPVRILLDSAPVRILSGTVRQVASRASEPSPDRPSSADSRVHVVKVELDADDALALVGIGGTAKIEANRSTLAALGMNFIKRRLRMPW